MATVASAQNRRGIAKLRFEVKNQDGGTVLKGEATVMQVEPAGQ